VFLTTDFQGDTNSNVECLRRVMEAVASKLASKGKSLPVNVAIQMDNTQKDNKNRKYAPLYSSLILFYIFLLLVLYLYLY